MHPWNQDGSTNCDLLAGGVDESGIFKGIYITGTNMLSLLRTFQLSKAFMPVDVPKPIATISQSLRDGVPLIIVTRGCWGRDMDYGPGPARNDMQQAVWNACREMRAEMPQVLITCIDIPNNLPSEVVAQCRDAPLNEYRELMYHEGSWYTPAIYNAAGIARWMAENGRETRNVKQGGVTFARKKFDWQGDKQYSNVQMVGWKLVLEGKK